VVTHNCRPHGAENGACPAGSLGFHCVTPNLRCPAMWHLRHPSSHSHSSHPETILKSARHKSLADTRESEPVC
jgi:hypothetical protein